jgi:nucleoid-associated protein YgaU
LAVTSGARPIAEQPRNASPKSVHPTGMAVDFRKPAGGPCLNWLRTSLVDLENRGVIEATEERHPAHFHVAVLNQERTPLRIAKAAPPVSTKTVAATLPVKVTTESNGEVSVPDNKESGTTYTVRAGDNLWNIARKHGTTPDRIQELNGLKGSRLRVKQVLKLP